MTGLIEKIQNCESMKELDALRIEVVQDMRKFGDTQKVFIQQKRKIKRIPLRDRPEDY